MSEEQSVTETEQQTVQSQEVNTQEQSAAVEEPYEPVEVTIKSLLKAGAHFGHKKDKWNPAMMPFIFGERNGVHIINLDITLDAWQKARKFLVDIASQGGSALFVGTKQQARKAIERAATRSDNYYVSNRWLGGTLSNFQTVKNSIRRMEQHEDLLRKAEDKDSEVRLAKKEKLQISRQIDRLENNIGGIRNMKKLPDVLLVIDINKEAIAINEARKLHIPVIALVDTNVNPKPVSFPIPSNDDASRTIELFVNAMADAVIEGRNAYQARIDANTFKKGQEAESAKVATSEEEKAEGSSQSAPASA